MEPCDFCGGMGEVPATSEFSEERELETCPLCNGKGKVNKI